MSTTAPTAKIERLAALLSRGMAPSVAGALLGLSPSYISQLQKDSDFKAALAEYSEQAAQETATATEERSHYTDKLAAAEHLLIDKITNVVRTDAYATEDFLLKALREVGARRDAMEKTAVVGSAINAAGMGTTLPNGTTIKMVQITVPSIVHTDMQISESSEIVSIGGRTMTPMPIDALREIVEGHLKVIDHDSL